MWSFRTALVVGLLACGPAWAQPAELSAGARALQTAEAGLRDTLRGMDEGRLPASLAVSRLRQALNEVERAMLQMPAEARQGAPWQTAVREVSQAMQLLRQDGTEPAAARAAAGEALGTLPALRGEETGSEGG
jgi:hypothetical protein